jgi:hypothetical protein
MQDAALIPDLPSARRSPKRDYTGAIQLYQLFRLMRGEAHDAWYLKKPRRLQ